MKIRQTNVKISIIAVAVVVFFTILLFIAAFSIVYNLYVGSNMV